MAQLLANKLIQDVIGKLYFVLNQTCFWLYILWRPNMRLNEVLKPQLRFYRRC